MEISDQISWNERNKKDFRLIKKVRITFHGTLPIEIPENLEIIYKNEKLRASSYKVICEIFRKFRKIYLKMLNFLQIYQNKKKIDKFFEHF